MLQYKQTEANRAADACEKDFKAGKITIDQFIDQFKENKQVHETHYLLMCIVWFGWILWGRGISAGTRSANRHVISAEPPTVPFVW